MYGMDISKLNELEIKEHGTDLGFFLHSDTRKKKLDGNSVATTDDLFKLDLWPW